MNSVNRVIVCFIDKGYPPDHSFVTGMLGEAIPRNKFAKVYLIVGRGDGAPRRVERYHGAIALTVLGMFPRAGVGKIVGMYKALKIGVYLSRKARSRGWRPYLFVRNDPLMLNVANILSFLYDGFVFQSSFPLEQGHGNKLKTKIHKFLYLMGAKSATAVLAVSPLGIGRIRETIKNPGIPGFYIPLLNDFTQPRLTKKPKLHEGVTFLYIGTHDPRRRIDEVLAAAVKVLEVNEKCAFKFVGGDSKQIHCLKQLPGIQKWVELGNVSFYEKVARHQVLAFLREADVGLSLIPADPIYKEASPTKLAEYMGSGLAVLASNGIELQEKFVTESGAGLLVDFEVNSMANGILKLAESMEQICIMKHKSKEYAESHLKYEKYFREVEQLFK